MQTGKGATSPSEHTVFEDDQTGARIHQLTSHRSINHPTYFLTSSFTPDQKTIIFTSYRTGAAQLFEAGFPNGPIRQLTGRQLTDDSAIHPFSPAIASDGDTVFFVRGGQVWELDRSTLDERLVADSGGQLGECSLSADGEWFVAACKKDGENGIFTGRTAGGDPRFLPFERTVIHPQFSPVDPEWIEFAGDPAPRMFRIRRDGTGLECLYDHDNNEFLVHETFLGETADLIFTVWPRALKRMDWNTREITTIAEFNAWHITPNRAGTKVLCDTNHPDIGLRLIDVASGEHRLICMPKSSNGGSQWRTSRYAVAEDWAAARAESEKDKALSWMEMTVDTVYGPQWSHPHPSFSPDETMVAFASDRSGHTQVYVVEIPESLRGE